MLEEMAKLGFEYVELSHGIRITLVPGILKAVEEGVIKVASLHNFCPLPTGVMQAAPNLFEPSADDPREHDQWLRHTKRTIDFAAQVQAKVVVCHLGSVKFFWFSPARALDKFAEAHAGQSLMEDPAYRALLEKSLGKLRHRMGPFWERTQASVREILGYAAEKGVKLGLENREAFTELPLDADYPAFLESLPPGAAAGYWHDTGHAKIKEDAGLLHHREHLQKLAARTIGFHLHDVDTTGKDHQPVGSGQIDFKMVSEFWRPEHLLTLELSPRVKVEGVISSKARIEELIQSK